MSNVHTHFHYHKPGRKYSLFEERHDGGWHSHRHIHTRRVPDPVASNDGHLGSSHGHDHIAGEADNDKFRAEPGQ